MIAKIRSMRKLSKKTRIQADSLPEIRGGVDQLAFDLKAHRVGDRPVSEGHIANAAVLVLLALPEEKRRALTVEAFSKMNALLAIDDPEERAEEVRSIIYGEPEQRPKEGVITPERPSKPKKGNRTG